MRSQEEWQQPAYHKGGGEGGDESGGPLAAQPGYDNYLSRQRAEARFWKPGDASSASRRQNTARPHKDNPDAGRASAQRSRPRRVVACGDCEFKFKRFEQVILGIIGALAVTGGVAGLAYAESFAFSGYPHWVFGIAGAAAGGAIVPALVWGMVLGLRMLEALITLLCELWRVAVRLAVAGALVYGAYQLHETLG